jgi:ABC-type amino acid transport substrate-binding protein
MPYEITKQIPPLVPPGTRSSHINRAFNAALAEFLAQGEGKRYEQRYERYIGIAPRFRPTGGDCDSWTDVDEQDGALQAMVDRRRIRFGYSPGAPYVYRQSGYLTGFDYELGNAVAERMSEHFFGKDGELTAEWVEVSATGAAGTDEQADKLTLLYDGLVAGSFDLALSGQMMLPVANLGGLAIQWTAPTAMLFTAISYTGRDRRVIDQEALTALHSADLPAFEAWAVAETRRLNLELRIFSVVNPGPSPKAAQDLVYAINHAGGRAVWDAGDIPDSDTVMYQAADHFSVGDSLASGAQATSEAFKGIYLNLPANDELWPIAGFTAGG